MSRARTPAIAVGLIALVALVYVQTAGHQFVDYDDGEYVYGNPEVLAGLAWPGVVWAFTTNHAANWHPMTWISHMADVSLFGPGPAAHHLVNAGLHAANAVLLFLVWGGMTGRLGASAAVAALFAAHPLNVQSVAWVSERKNLLSTLFWLLAMLAYVAYARRPSRRRMAIVAALLLLGLLSKQMLVTLPLALLIMDAWPLRRLAPPIGSGARGAWSRFRPLVVEKIPLFALCAAAAAVAYVAQVRGKAMAPADVFPLRDRLANAAISYVRYVVDAAWPSSLSFFYPHPANVGQPVSASAALLCAVLLAALTAVSWRAARRCPFLAAGWAWYLVTLLPVIGIVQVGAHARADRYAYVPMIGIFVAVVWAVALALERVPAGRAVGAGLAVIAVAALALAAHREAGYWRDGGALYGRALQLDPRNWLAWNNLGTFRLAANDGLGALECFQSAVRIKPDFSDAQYNTGVALQRLGRDDAALPFYREALRLDPSNADAWVNLGNCFASLGSPGQAITCFERALDLRPADPLALNGLTLASLAAGDRPRAMRAFDRLSRVDPAMAQALRAGGRQ